MTRLHQCARSLAFMTPQLNLMYIESDIPTGMTCTEYRRGQQPIRRRRGLRARLRRGSHRR